MAAATPTAPVTAAYPWYPDTASATAAMAQMATVSSHPIRESGTRLSSRIPMTDAIPAEVALAYLSTLSVDLRAAVVLGEEGATLAGDAALAAPALAVARAAQEGTAGQAPHGDGRLFAASRGGVTLALAVGPHALEAVVVHDLLTTLADLRDC